MSKYVELFRIDHVASFPAPLHTVFDKTIGTEGYAQIRAWVHVFVENYAQTPVTSASKLNVRFLHLFGQQLGGGGQFDYTHGSIPWNNVTSYIDGYVSAPIIGDKLRILCAAESLPAGPYNVFATYYLL